MDGGGEGGGITNYLARCSRFSIRKYGAWWAWWRSKIGSTERGLRTTNTNTNINTNTTYQKKELMHASVNLEEVLPFFLNLRMGRSRIDRVITVCSKKEKEIDIFGCKEKPRKSSSLLSPEWTCCHHDTTYEWSHLHALRLTAGSWYSLTIYHKKDFSSSTHAHTTLEKPGKSLGQNHYHPKSITVTLLQKLKSHEK